MTLRERVARAIVERWHPGGMAASLAENGEIILPPHTWGEAMAAANAALDELTKPPTDAMTRAGIITLRDTPGAPELDPTFFYRDKVRSIWEAMTRAVMEEK